jgi:hypothetical protein
VTVSVWRLPVLPDDHYRKLVAYGCETHRDRQVREAQPTTPPVVTDEGRGALKLQCLHCNPGDHVGIDVLPADWAGVCEVAESGDSRGVTHQGVCPSCAASYERTDLPGDVPEGDAGNIHPIVRQIICRDCHVGESPRAVVRHVISKLKDGYDTFRRMTPIDRRELVSQCVRQQRENRVEYVEVMSGFTRTLGEHEENDFPSALTGDEIVTLMRRHKMTIAMLAFRLGTSEKRVRNIREHGLTNALAVRDWIEAITGNDPGPLPVRYRLSNRQEVDDCGFCGCPLDVGDYAFEYVGEVFCSTSCCRKSRGW